MKNSSSQGASRFVSPPPETKGDTVKERRAAAHQADPLSHMRDPSARHDRRMEIAAGEAMHRVRARQVEPRTAEQCHDRVRRRAGEAEA